MELQKETIEMIMNYLAGKPWGEVYKIINAVQSDLAQAASMKVEDGGND